MDIVISHRTALRYWRTYAEDVAALPRARNAHGMPRPLALTDELRSELAKLGIHPSPERPTDMLFAGKRTRSRATYLRAHYTTRPLPTGSLIRLSPHVLITSPELTLLQLASDMTDGQLLLAGAEFCGTYSLFAKDGHPLPNPEERRPLTSAALLAKTAENLGYGPRSRVRRLLHYVVDGAASPMEARLAYLLAMPRTRGGFGLPQPALNAEIPLSPAARAVYPHALCRVDLYWLEEKFALEYDGRSSHEEKLASDAARIAALRIEGVEVLAVTAGQFYNDRALAQIAELVAKRLHYRIRADVNGERCIVARRKLRRELQAI